MKLLTEDQRFRRWQIKFFGGMLIALAILLPVARQAGKVLADVAYGNHPFPEEIAGQCPFDSTFTRWTGQTRVINGVTHYVMVCGQGHETLAKSPN